MSACAQVVSKRLLDNVLMARGERKSQVAKSNIFAFTSVQVISYYRLLHICLSAGDPVVPEDELEDIADDEKEVV